MSTAELIKEAYISPIRSVMVVDDEYPTMEKLLSGGIPDLEDRDKDNLLDVINLCRDSKNNWMLDVHDGDFGYQETDTVNNLHHSDLLILDYHLEGNGDDGKGEKALHILSSLANKEHFNLVVVHTKGYENSNSNGNHQAVFSDIVFELQKHPTRSAMPSSLTTRVEEALDIWAEESENIIEELSNSISDLDYIKLTVAYRRPMNIPDTKPEIQELKSLYDSRPVNSDPILEKLELRCLIWYVLSRKGNELDSRFGNHDFNGFAWHSDENCNWIKTENLFVTVVEKSVSTRDLPEKLLVSLEQWSPHPNRLLMAKLRHQLDEKGASVANSLITRQYVQAGWLKDLLSCDDALFQQQAWICIQNHMEELSFSFKDDLCDYLSRLASPLISARNSHMQSISPKKGTEAPTLNEEQKRGIKESSISRVLSSITPKVVLDDPFLMFKEINAFNNSIAVVEGSHLVTGHVLMDTPGNFFLVVTPACDLVPGRSDYGKIEVQIQSLYPISAALRQVGDKGKLADDEIYKRSKSLVNTKKLLFLLVDGEIKILSCLFNVYSNAEPSVKSIIIGSDGVWADDKKLIAYEPDLSDDLPKYKQCEYHVVAQLRYEYALHHSKVSGEYHSRIGLDYQ